MENFNIIFLIYSIKVSAYSGSIAGNPADFDPLAKPQVWFLGNKEIQWCVEFGEEDHLYTSKDVALKLINLNFQTWSDYLKIKILREEWYKDVPFINLKNKYNATCNGNEDLTFYIGKTDEKIQPYLSRFVEPHGLSRLLKYDSNIGWGKGFIWIRPIDLNEILKSPIFYPLEQQFAALLNHEFGHMLGIGHISETIMRENLAEVLNSGHVNLLKDDKFHMTIDQTKELFFSSSRGVGALAEIIFNLNENEKLFFKTLFGFDFNFESFHMGFMQSENETSHMGILYVAYADTSGELLPLPKVHVVKNDQGQFIYAQRHKLKGKKFLVKLFKDTMVQFSTSDNPIFRVVYKYKEYKLNVPGYLIEGELIIDENVKLPIKYIRNKGADEYVNLTAQLNGKQVPIFKGLLSSQPYW